MTTRQPRVGNLPAETTSMVGRHSDLARIDRLCERSRLVTLTGPGGVGKTRLALRAAARQRPRFADGAWLVELFELSELDSGTLLAHTIAEALPIADQTLRPMIDVLAEYLADRDLLLVLDTCEHVIDACALTVEALLAAAPGLTVLATSRRPLGAPAETVLVVDPLPVPGTAPPPPHERAGEADAVRLLADRAAAAVPGFAVTEHNRADVLRLCRRLEGLPLAIELAAARLAELAPSELADRLADRFALLGDTEHAVNDAEPPWHRALRTAIGWSHQLCTEDERLAWARLSVFAGTFEARAAMRVCADRRLAGDRIPALLAALAGTSILTPIPGGGGERYRMLDTIREYGAIWLRALGEQDALRRRHRDFYLEMARRGCAEWAGPDQVLWCERLIAEHANMRAAVDFCLTEPDGRTAVDMAGCVGFLWRHCGFPRDGQHYLDLVLDPDPEPGPERTWALFARGSVAFAQGELKDGGRWGEACAAAAARPGRRDNDAAVAAAALTGMSLAMRGDPARAAEVLDAAPDAPVRDRRYRIAPLHLRLARLHTHIVAGEFARARVKADELLADCARHGERWVRAYADYLRAMVDIAQGDPHSAMKHARAGLEGHWRLHNNAGLAVVLDGLAAAVMATGDGDRAARLLGLGQHFWDLIGSAQMDSPGLIAIRRGCESRARDAIGDAAFRAAFREGRAGDIDDNLARALDPAPSKPR